MGEAGNPPLLYFEFRAAEALGCSVIELREHPAQFRLMREAFTYLSGTNEGETALRCNPKFKSKIKSLQKRMS